MIINKIITKIRDYIMLILIKCLHTLEDLLRL